MVGLIKTVDIEVDTTNFYMQDTKYADLLSRVVSKVGQTELILICNVNDVRKVIKGHEMLSVCSQLGIDEVVVKDLGDIGYNEYLGLKAFLNIYPRVTNHINIANEFKELATPADKMSVAMKAGMSSDDVERYSTLLEFDWDAFLKAPLPSQLSMFDI
jgi:hypothetical protein